MYCIFAIEIQSHHFFIRKVELFVPWCLKITKNVSFNDNAKNGQFGQFLKKPCGQTVVPERSSSIRQNWWKMPKMKNSNETFWVIFNQCAVQCIKVHFYVQKLFEYHSKCITKVFYFGIFHHFLSN